MENNFTQKAVIKVIGVGGAGNNAVNRMIDEDVKGVEFIVANTDAQVLLSSSAENKIILGEKTSKGLGAGANPEIGKQAALESETEIKKALAGADLIFVAAGMGGGTGTGAAPIVAKIAAESGALVIGIVTKPFRFEGRHRLKYSEQGLVELKKYVDSVIVISNDKLLLSGGIPIEESFKEADSILKEGVKTITDLIATPAVINLDFADVKTVMSKKGNALFGRGAAGGERSAETAAKRAISSSLLDTKITGAKDIIINIMGGPNTSLNDAYDVVDIITDATENEDVNIVFGISVNQHLGQEDDIVVSVIATGFSEKPGEEIVNERPTRQARIVERDPLDKILKSEVEINKPRPVPAVEEPLKAEDIFDNDDFPTFLK
ncbi:cell division protein FtsZ [Mesoplasma seiffertii]|uniref:cell division protein FtsZ n=1 Tax=Mesoplasma seiffertii TaxID=28224 RepID=UPI000479396D|nr:cell division protein FtsZ [Mesoplasma seiffertii]